MATDMERLTVVLEANIKKYEKEMARTRQVTDSAMKSVERSASASMRRLDGIIGGGAARLKAGFAGILAGVSVREIAQLADSYTRVQNALKVTGLEGEKLKSTYDAIYAISQRQSAPLEAMATLYGRVSAAQKDLNATGPEILRVTEGVGMALRISGTSAQEASGALLQLSQALSGGKVQAEEYNSLIDGARPVLEAVAAGMVEAGGSVSKLTALVKDGKVSSEAFFRAFLAGMPVIEAKSASASATMSQGMGKTRDALVNLIGKLDEATGASKNAGESFSGVAEAIASIADKVPGAMEALNSLSTKMTEIGNNSVWRKIYNGLDAVGLAGMNGVTDIKVDAAARTSQAAVDDQRGVQRFFPKIDPVKNADFKLPGDKSGGGKSSSQRENEYQREIEQIGERTRALEAERATVGKSAGDVAKAEASFRLLEAAKKANVNLTPQMLSDIDAMATKYGEATQAIEDARDAQEQVAGAIQDLGTTLSGAFTDAIVEGEKLDEVGRRLLKTFASKGIESVFSNLFSTGTGGAGGGGIGNLLSSLFAPGKASGGPVKAGQPYTVGESGRETFVPTSPGRIIPHGRGGGSPVQVNVINEAGVETQTQRRSDGGVDVIIPMLEGALGDRASRGHGALYKASTARAGGRALRG